MNTVNTPTSIWSLPGFRAYLASTAFSGMGLAMQQLLASWMLIGMLVLPADEVGFIQAVIGIPGVFLMLMGGASADRSEPRQLLVRLYAVAPLFPLALIALYGLGFFNVWSVMLWALGVGVVSSYSMPAQQALLNRVSGDQVQQSVTAATAAGFVVQILGLILAGQTDQVGLSWVLGAQGLVFVLAAWTTSRIKLAIPPNEVKKDAKPAWQGIAEGLGAVWRDRVIFHVLLINFVSSIFNAGSFLTVFPFIVKRVYDGDALILSLLMAVFFAGGAVSNALLLKYMPLRHPGRLYLIMQLSRILVLGLLWIEPSWWLMVIATIGWGFNMGVTSNLARTIVQESAEAAFRGRILSVFSVGMVGSAPIGAIVLGLIIEQFGILNALIPAMVTSLILFAYGMVATNIWRYRSTQ